jgi:hypothetical protein
MNFPAVPTLDAKRVWFKISLLLCYPGINCSCTCPQHIILIKHYRKASSALTGFKEAKVWRNFPVNRKDSSILPAQYFLDTSSQTWCVTWRWIYRIENERTALTYYCCASQIPPWVVSEGLKPLPKILRTFQT